MSAQHFVYLSPHFDDAAISCGGMLVRHAQRGDAVTVITVCAGTPDYQHLSPFAQDLHVKWGRPRDPIAKRRAEDTEAMRRLAAPAVYLGITDAIYRRDRRGRPIVTSDKTLFGKLSADEHARIAPLAKDIKRHLPAKRAARIVAPLATGRHLDHQLVRAAARVLAAQGYAVAWYEDFPYAEARGSVTRARKQFGAGDWSCALFPIEVEPKIHAIAAYTSQMRTTFQSLRDMAARVRAYYRAVAGGDGYAERVWYFSAAAAP
jgi:LmbE family N-acetylglucosaminyl deacetylase